MRAALSGRARAADWNDDRPKARPGLAGQTIGPENASMKANEIERAAYMAAHRILMADLSAAELACPSARRSRAVDAIAGIIKEVFELSAFNCDNCIDHAATCSVEPLERSRPAVVIELPRRASS